MPPSRLVDFREVPVDPLRVALGDDIRRARERLQMTQQQLADEVGVSSATVSNWERDITNPKNRLALVRQVLRMEQQPDGSRRRDDPLGLSTDDAATRSDPELWEMLKFVQAQLEHITAVHRRVLVEIESRYYRVKAAAGTDDVRSPARGRPGHLPEHLHESDEQHPAVPPTDAAEG